MLVQRCMYRSASLAPLVVTLTEGALCGLETQQHARAHARTHALREGERESSAGERQGEGASQTPQERYPWNKKCWVDVVKIAVMTSDT
eukprot:1908214-Amphidinium_carterae.1